MATLQNNWVRYIDRTYQQIKDRVLTDLGVLVPEMTDHTESNLYVKMLGIWAGIAEMLGYYIDNAAREAHLMTARLYWSGIKIARSYDYRVHAYLPSSGNVTFSIPSALSADTVIPTGTEIQSEDGLLYYTTEQLTILAGQTEGTVSVKQYTPVAEYQLGTSTGQPNQSFIIDDQVVDSSVVIKVNGLGWEFVDTLGYSLPNDEVFVQSVNEQGQPIVYFGDGVNGAVPPSGATITVQYQRTEGVAGNTGAGTLTQVNGSSIPNLSVTNIERTSGGSGVESLAQLQHRIPLAIRTLFRAVTKQDFIDVTELKPGVAKAGVYYECGSPVQDYIVPDGGGIASQALIDDTQAWIDYRRIITINAVVLPAGEIHIEFQIKLQVLPQYTNAVVADAVRQRLSDFMSYKYQNVGGFVQLSDVYEIIENTDGVEFSDILVMRPVPYARPINGTTTDLNWTRHLTPASTVNAVWKIRFITASTYELTKDTTMLGVFTLGVPVSTNGITFQVLAGGYVPGDEWEFHTYPYYGTTYLDEPSLPVSLPADIIINATGGL